MRKVFNDMVEVLGNARFFLLVFTILLSLMLGSQGWLTWRTVMVFVPLWLIFNLVVDIPLRHPLRLLDLLQSDLDHHAGIHP